MPLGGRNSLSVLISYLDHMTCHNLLLPSIRSAGRWQSIYIRTISSYVLSLFVTKMVLVWPNWFGLDHNDLVTTKINWSGPNVIHFGRKSQFVPDQFILVVIISFWSWPNHYGQVQINLVRPKPFWTDQNCFGHIEGQGIRLVVIIFSHSLQMWFLLENITFSLHKIIRNAGIIQKRA